MNRGANVKPAQTGRTKSRKSMRDFVQAENFYAALRFGLDRAPLRYARSRPKPCGETKKFSACSLFARVFHRLHSRTDQRVLTQQMEPKSWEWTFTVETRNPTKVNTSAPTSGTGTLSPICALRLRRRNAGDANTGIATMETASTRNNLSRWRKSFSTLSSRRKLIASGSDVLLIFLQQTGRNASTTFIAFLLACGGFNIH